MKIGVYVCHCGGNISEVVDVKGVAEFSRKQADVVLTRDYEHMCSEIGQKMVQDDIKEHKLDKIVIAACSPQFQGITFMRTLEDVGLSPYVLEMANIREQCSWPHFDTPAEATEKAKDLTGMAIAKARYAEPLERKTKPIGKRVLVVGAGVAGIQASLDLGDAGFQVYLVEKNPSIGGRMAQLSRTFPTEDCAACILSPKMADVPVNKNINLLVNSEVEKVSGYLGNFQVTINKKPSYVNPTKCVACGLCEEKCPVKVVSEADFEVGLLPRKAIYLPFDFAVPHEYIIDEKNCLFLTKGRCRLCEKICPQDAIEFDQKPEKMNITVDTIIVATGYDVFDARNKPMYGYGRYKNVISSLQMERFIANATAGKPIRTHGKRIAFIQCVGSRDEQIGREYCSRICCMYATKLSQLLKRGDPSRDIYVFYTDLRAYGKGFEEYYKRAQRTGVKFIRGRVAEAIENPQTKKVTLRVEDTLTRQLLEFEFDLVVLSVGLQPSEGTNKIAEVLKLAKSPDGFIQEAHPKFRPVDTLIDGIFVAGTAQGPKDIPDTVAQASGAAARAIRLMNRGVIDVPPITAFVDEDLCDGCALCIEHCPLEAISISDGLAVVNDSVCTGCGICIAYCPKEALDLHCYTNEQMEAQVEAVLADKKDGKVRILVFADDTCTYRLADSVGTNKLAYSTDSRIIRVPSGARVTPKLMLNAFKLGADGIFIGECEQKTAPFRNTVQAIEDNLTIVREALKAAGISPGRMRYATFVTIMLPGLIKNINNLSELAREEGAIPVEKLAALGEAVLAKTPNSE